MRRQLGGREAAPQSRCDRFDPDELSAYVEGTLPARHKEEFERHLVRCGQCRKSVVTLSRLAAEEPVEAVHAVPTTDKSADAPEPRVVLPWRRRVLGSIGDSSWTRLAAAAVLLIAVMGPLYLILRDGQDAWRVAHVVESLKAVPDGGGPPPPAPVQSPTSIPAQAPAGGKDQPAKAEIAKPETARTADDVARSAARTAAAGEVIEANSIPWEVAVSIDESQSVGATATLMQAKPKAAASPAQDAASPARQPDREEAAPAAPAPPPPPQPRQRAGEYATAASARDDQAIWNDYRQRVGKIWHNELKRVLGQSSRPTETIRFRLTLSQRGEIISLQQGRIPAHDFLEESSNREINEAIASMGGRLKLPPLPTGIVQGVQMIITLRPVETEQ